MLGRLGEGGGEHKEEKWDLVWSKCYLHVLVYHNETQYYLIFLKKNIP